MLRVVATAVAAFMLAACGVVGGGDDDGPTVTVGAVTFAENQIVAEMYARVLEEAGTTVERRFNFQSREDLLPALSTGEVDIAPEYLASLWTSLDEAAAPSSNAQDNVEGLAPLLRERGLELLEPSDANNTNALVVDDDTADRLNLEEVSDLDTVSRGLVFGGPPECPDRRFCLQGLRSVYGLRFKEFRPLDAGGPLTIAALSSGEIDVALLFSTSGVIEERGWVLLQDDRGLQAADNITPLVRSEVLTESMTDQLNSVSESLTTDMMTELNAAVEVRGEDFRDVAEGFLDDKELGE